MDKYEKETIINFNEGELEAEIYSCTKAIWNKCEKLGLEIVTTYTLKGKITGKTYKCPKTWIKIVKPRKMNFSQEEREIRSNRMREVVKKRKSIDVRSKNKDQKII